jgi:hypothetical protein
MSRTLWTTGKNEAKNGRRYLDGEECVRLWYQGLNSLQQVANILNANGVRTKEGHYINRDAVAKAAWRWIFRNPERAVKDYIAPGKKARGNEFVWDEFWMDYVSHLYTSYASASLCRSLIELHGLGKFEQELLEKTGKCQKGNGEYVYHNC